MLSVLRDPDAKSEIENDTSSATQPQAPKKIRQRHGYIKSGPCHMQAALDSISINIIRVAVAVVLRADTVVVVQFDGIHLLFVFV